MSAIYGIFHYDGCPVEANVGAAMQEKMAVFPADACKTFLDKDVFLGCRAQFITPESLCEVLPYQDLPNRMTITADAIIDNRMSLLAAMGIAADQGARIPDSLLILKAYQKWGRECPKYLIGDFAFVIWDERQRCMFCAVDHAGTRTLYYYRAAGVFAFSTLLKPLFSHPAIPARHDDMWIGDFLAIPSVMHQLDAELTLYQDVYLLPAGHSLSVGGDGSVIKEVYWQVQEQPELVLKSDAEYEEALRDVLSEAVRCRMRSILPVGVMLSGGLDSPAVAALAAKELKGQRLAAFSMTPMIGYRDWLPIDGSAIADETPFVEAVSQYIGNIDVTYCRASGLHPMSDTERLTRILEQPYKIFENLFWIDNIIAEAKQKGVGVLLHGSVGNMTISWGEKQSYLVSLLQYRRWRRLLRESWVTSRRYREPNKMLYALLGGLLPVGCQKILSLLQSGNHDAWVSELPPINPAFAEKMGSRERFNRFGYDLSGVSRKTSFECRQDQMQPSFFAHVSTLSTKLLLSYGMVMRDPTLDRRVIEFCLRLPEDQYVRNGRERFLIRRAMKGLLPDKVRLNERVRGNQTADIAQRLQPVWPELTTEISLIGRRPAEKKYLDICKIKRQLEKHPVINDDESENSGVRMLIRSLIFSRFLQSEGKI
ncbi:asparagine synthase-related protein [Azotosporobacter soli]|uniref:asparagine synthase-related protein n=1 Tax=Azotosporobacter soli TaxID=3055040 RepID=UPI0031FE8796